MVSPSAPTYDRSSVGLMPEESIRALEVSIKNELDPRSSSPDVEQAGEEANVGASGGYTGLLLRTSSPSLAALSAATPLPSPARVSALRRDADSALRASLSSSLLVPSSSLSVPDASLLAQLVPSSPIWAPTSSLSVPSLSLPAPSSSHSVPAPASSRSIPTLTFTPHAGAAFLAASAPGSRFTSPLPSPSSRGTMSTSQRLGSIRGAP